MESLLDEVIRLFLDDTPHLLDQIHQAVQRADHGNLVRLGHTMAGSASNFGPNVVVRAARAVEAAARTQAPVAELVVASSDLDRAFERFQVALLSEAVPCS